MHSTTGNNTLVESFRLWNSGWRMSDKDESLYVGQLMNESLVRRLGLVSYWHGTAATDQQLAQLADLFKAAGYQVEQRDSWLLIRQ
jgi:hypothetical protein